ncbi:MAG: enoyl-CoA hydratase-related protein, partial [Pseudomonadota bacterium]
LSEVRLGLVPAVISPYVIAAIGARQARRYFLTGEVFDAGAAAALGLVHAAVAPDALDSAVEGLVTELLKGGPCALGESKKLIAAVGGADDASTAALRAHTAQLIARLRGTPEGQEGLSAFLDKRPPAWLGEG